MLSTSDHLGIKAEIWAKEGKQPFREAARSAPNCTHSALLRVDGTGIHPQRRGSEASRDPDFSVWLTRLPQPEAQGL